MRMIYFNKTLKVIIWFATIAYFGLIAISTPTFGEPTDESSKNKVGAGITMPPSSVPETNSISKNFTLLGIDEKAYELNRLGGKAVAILFYGIGCPISRDGLSKLLTLQEQYEARGVTFWIVDSEYGDMLDELWKEADEYDPGTIPVLLDESQGVGRMLGAEQTATVVLLNLPERRIVYRGAIDDQWNGGIKKDTSTQNYLQDAIDQTLSDLPVGKAQTPSQGRIIRYESTSSTGEKISYTKQVAPIIIEKCVFCHRDNDVAPFSFSSYHVVRAMAPMIEEVVLSRRMPPWHLDANYGEFLHDISLSPIQKRTLLQWINEGANNEDLSDPLADTKTVRRNKDWPKGEPDFVITTSERQTIPATGVLDYRRFRTQVPFDRDVWIGASVMIPDNPKVVHHATIYLQRKGFVPDNKGFDRGEIISGWAPGEDSITFINDAGYLVPQGSTLEMEIHYNPIGKVETDFTKAGFYLLKKAPRNQLKFLAGDDFDLSIPPYETGRAFSALMITKKSKLIALHPHMHLRGRSMRFDVLWPNGEVETVLSVPNYDFYWQRTYYLKKARELPAGSVIIARSTFDNSAQNPRNPNPAARVRWGFQSKDEMAGAYVIVEQAIGPGSN